jgi:3-hydroxybutyryl-CoA dehydrogenase
MKLVVLAHGNTREEFLSKKIPEQTEIAWVDTTEEMDRHPDAAAFFNLSDEPHYPDDYTGIVHQPVFINAVTATLTEMQGIPNLVRINAWPGFLNRPVIEIAAGETIKAKAAEVLEFLAWGYQFVADVPGMISARVIAMIINEAYFALGEEVSTKSEIDVAMKLGTNYPFGPFEWGEKTGLANIFGLLKKLSLSDQRYLIAPALEEEMKLKA